MGGLAATEPLSDFVRDHVGEKFTLLLALLGGPECKRLHRRHLKFVPGAEKPERVHTGHSYGHRPFDLLVLRRHSPRPNPKKSLVVSPVVSLIQRVSRMACAPTAMSLPPNSAR